MRRDGNRWQIKLDDETGDEQAALQIIYEGKVLAWLMLTPDQLEELSKGAAEMAVTVRERGATDEPAVN